VKGNVDSQPYYSDGDVTLYHGDCRDVLKALADESVDAVVTDPPYELNFMGRSWDSTGIAYNVELWRECLRVLKPGGHLLAFGGTRTAHRMTCAIEDAGFEIRDGIDWLYAQGFPKSLDVSKAIDKARDDRADINRVTGWLAERRDRAGLTNRDIDAAFGFNGMAGHWTAAPHLKIAAVPQWEQWLRLRELIGFDEEMDAEVWRLNGRKGAPGEAWSHREVIGVRDRKATGRMAQGQGGYAFGEQITDTAPATDDARRWEGWGTALKPAREPIVLARKPLAGTVAANVLQHGTGAINIDACRIEARGRPLVTSNRSSGNNTYGDGLYGSRATGITDIGRWPTNVAFTHAGNEVDGDLCVDGCVDGCPVAELDRQSGVLTSGANPTRRGSDKFRDAYGDFKGQTECVPARGADSGRASRFFPVFRYEAKASASERPKVDGTAHTTVKPLDLMRWLVRLVTPPGGLVLDPFVGSGTTAEACVVEGFRCVAMEKEAAHLPLIVARLSKPIQPTLGEVS
jgi:hypothetical protein